MRKRTYTNLDGNYKMTFSFQKIWCIQS